MNTQLAAPTSGTVPLIAIPAAVTQLGPQLSRLPDELLHKIFKILATTMFPLTSRFNTLITSKTFTILNHYHAINRIRNISPTCRALFTETFYQNFTFAFKHSPVFNTRTDYLTSLPAPVPALHLRHHLRSMHIDIALETHYFTPQTLFSVPRTCRQGRSLLKITSTAHMVAFCPSAVFLARLTSEQHGFGSLRFLHLHLCVDDRHFKVDEVFLKVVEEMGFVVRAEVVEVVVSDGAGFGGRRYEEVGERIGVVH